MTGPFIFLFANETYSFMRGIHYLKGGNIMKSNRANVLRFLIGLHEEVLCKQFKLPREERNYEYIKYVIKCIRRDRKELEALA